MKTLTIEDIKVGSIWKDISYGKTYWNIRIDEVKDGRVYYTFIKEVLFKTSIGVGTTEDREAMSFLARWAPVYTVEGFEV